MTMWVLDTHSTAHLALRHAQKMFATSFPKVLKPALWSQPISGWYDHHEDGHVWSCVLIPACCSSPVSFISWSYHHLLEGNRWACLFGVPISKQISQEWPVNTANKDPSWRASPWASNKRENEELILDETQGLFIRITANGKRMPLRDRVGGKLWQWLITPETGRAGDYLRAQHWVDTIAYWNPNGFGLVCL